MMCSHLQKSGFPDSSNNSTTEHDRNCSRTERKVKVHACISTHRLHVTQPLKCMLFQKFSLLYPMMSYVLLNVYANPEIKAFITYTSEHNRIQLVWMSEHTGIDGN
jgi:hypothetical protein